MNHLSCGEEDFSHRTVGETAGSSWERPGVCAPHGTFSGLVYHRHTVSARSLNLRLRRRQSPKAQGRGATVVVNLSIELNVRHERTGGLLCPLHSTWKLEFQLNTQVTPVLGRPRRSNIPNT